MALKFTPDINGPKYKNQGIWILEKGKAKRVEIKTGAYDDSSTEIISDKIQEGTDVIISIKSKKSKQNNGRNAIPRRL